MPSSQKKWTIWLLGTDNFYNSDADSLINEADLIADEATIDEPTWLPLHPLVVADDYIKNDDSMRALSVEYSIPLEKLFFTNSEDVTYLEKLQKILAKKYFYLSARGTGQDISTYYPLPLHPDGKFIHIITNGKANNERNLEEASITRTFNFRKYKYMV